MNHVLAFYCLPGVFTTLSVKQFMYTLRLVLTFSLITEKVAMEIDNFGPSRVGYFSAVSKQTNLCINFQPSQTNSNIYVLIVDSIMLGCSGSPIKELFLSISQV